MGDSYAKTGRKVFTIGHSNHTMDHFLRLLLLSSVEVVADTRSHPHSKFSPQFSRVSLDNALRGTRIKYVYLGLELGGRPEGPEFYDDKGRVRYDKIAESFEFQTGLARLRSGIDNYSVALLCSEEDPAVCHRSLLIGRVLADQGIAVEHIRGDGTVQSEAEMAKGDTDTDQMLLFEEAVAAAPWRSTQSVSQKRRRSSFSGF